MINKLCKEAYENAKNKGFHDKPVEMGTRLALIHGEVSEALEADRNTKHCKYSIDNLKHSIKELYNSDFKNVYEREVKGTFEEELADIAIRLFDLCGYMNIDLEVHIQAKMRYNSLRSHMHGGKKY